MKLEVEIENVAAQTEKHYFVAVHLEYKDSHTPPIKLRTDVAPLTHRPKFKRNVFSFDKLIEHQVLKFGLMACVDSNQASINTAKPTGIGSLNISLNRLKEIAIEGMSKIIPFLSNKKQVGQFQCKIRFTSQSSFLKKSKVQTNQNYTQFNPLISRVLFSEQAAKDQIKTKSSIIQLEKQALMLYKNFQNLKAEEETLETIYQGLEKDEQEIKTQIELNEKINQKISVKMSQRESAESLKLEIDMLRNSEEGKGLLLQKLEYYDEIITIEQHQQLKLAGKYEKIKHELNARIERAENYAQKLKGKELQLFELNRNRQILSKYEDVDYQFNCNQHIIERLVAQAKKSQLSADQAALILSQVNYKIKMQEIDTGGQEQDTLINLIEKEAEVSHKQEEKQQSSEQKVILGIKLSALQEQILIVRSKIQLSLAKKNMQQSGVRRI